MVRDVEFEPSSHEKLRLFGSVYLYRIFTMNYNQST